jgi:MYXO-CTERM domain-containing protein
MLSNRLAKHFAAAAAVTVVAGAANAAVVHWADANLLIPANIDGLYINVETRASGSAGSGVAGWDINPYSATSLTWFNATGTGMLRYPGATTGSAGNLAVGTVVDAAGSYGSGAVTVGSAAGNWQLNASNYFGFKFTAADGLTHYGWGRFVVGASISGADRMIAEIAYEGAANTSINVGAVPAPGAVALLGLAGLAARRRR